MNTRFTGAVWAAGMILAAAVWGADPESRNLLVNPSIEDWSGIADNPVRGWRYYTSGKKITISRETNTVQEGSCAVRFELQGTSNAAQGLVQHVAVSAGTSYEFTACVRSAPDAPMGGAARIELGVEWRDSLGREISRHFASGGVGIPSRLKWERASLSKLKPPKGALEAIVGVHILDGQTGGKGCALVDNLQWVEK